MARYDRGACEACGSSDNRVTFSDGGSWCFSPGCSGNTADTLVLGKKITKTIRGIAPSFWEEYRVTAGDDGTLYFPYFSDTGHLVAIKKRTPEKKFPWLGNTDKVSVFGLPTINPRRQTIIITEGEIDAVSAHQMTGWNAVSIAQGGKSAAQSIKRVLELVEQFDKVFVCFDQDEAGRAAVEELAPILDPAKCRIVILPTGMKDANDMLVAGQSEEFKECLNRALAPRVSGVHDKAALVASAKARLLNPDLRTGVSTGLSGLDNIIGGLREGNVITLAAGTGIGKSTLSRYIAYLVAKAGTPALYMGPEETGEENISKFASLVAHLNLNKYAIDEAALDAALTTVAALPLDIWHEDVVDGDVLKKLEFAVRSGSHRLLVIDHVDFLIDSIGGDDAVRVMRAFMRNLKAFAVRRKLTVIAVSHLTRSKDDAADSGFAMNRLFGGQAKQQYSDIIVSLERDRFGEAVVLGKVWKNRTTGVCGEFSMGFVDYGAFTTSEDKSNESEDF